MTNNSAKKILVLGATYGALTGMRIAAAGHAVSFVTISSDAASIQKQGLSVDIPLALSDKRYTLSAKDCPIQPQIFTPDQITDLDFDLVVFAMQEPQYSATDIRELMLRIAQAKLPCLSIMNMPLPNFIERTVGIKMSALKSAYTSFSIWQEFDSKYITACSPDAQAVRKSADNPCFINVTLASNIKIAPFHFEHHQNLLTEICYDVNRTRVKVQNKNYRLTVQLKPIKSALIPLCKWPMLMTGNYRCSQGNPILSIKDAIYTNPGAAQKIYDEVTQICLNAGLEEKQLVTFESYKKAASSLTSPSSVAKSLAKGVQHVERVDILIQLIAQSQGVNSTSINAIVAHTSSMLAN